MPTGAVVRGRWLAIGLGAVLACSPVAAAVAATDLPATEPPAPPELAGLEVVVTPLTGPDSDLVAVEDGPGVGLFFSPTAPVRQRAPHEVVVTNTGPVPLQGLVVTTDRTGPVPTPVTPLSPGEQVVLRAELWFDFDEVARGLGGLHTTPVLAEATTVDGTVVRASAEATIGLAAVLSTPSIGIDLVAVSPDGDGTAGLRWTAADAEGGVERVLEHRVVVRNQSTVPLRDIVLESTALDEPVALVVGDATLAPGATVTAEFSRTLTAAGLGLVPGPDDVVVDVVTEATVTAKDAVLGSPGAARELTTVTATVEAIVLPVTGPPRAGEVLLVALLSLGFGMALLIAAPRRVAPEVIRQRTAAAARLQHLG